MFTKKSFTALSTSCPRGAPPPAGGCVVGAGAELSVAVVGAGSLDCVVGCVVGWEDDGAGLDEVCAFEWSLPKGSETHSVISPAASRTATAAASHHPRPRRRPGSGGAGAGAGRSCTGG